MFMQSLCKVGKRLNENCYINCRLNKLGILALCFSDRQSQVLLVVPGHVHAASDSCKNSQEKMCIN